MNKKVLIIDDNDEYRNLLPQYLTGKGCTVDTACGGKEGLDKAKTMLPDIVVLDVMMPDVSGIEVLRELQADERTRKIPVLVVSGRAFDENIKSFFAQEPNYRDFIPKTEDLASLYKKMEQLMAG